MGWVVCGGGNGGTGPRNAVTGGDRAVLGSTEHLSSRRSCEQQLAPADTSRCEAMLGTQLEILELGGGRQGLPFALAPAPGRQCLSSAACQTPGKYFRR